MVPSQYSDRFKNVENKGRRTVAGMVAALDEGIGNVTRALKEASLWDDTLIIFSTSCAANADKSKGAGSHSSCRCLLSL